MRRAARTDTVQSDIVNELRQLCFSVAVTHRLGDGFPDIVVGDSRDGRNYLFEIKTDREILTEKEEKFRDNWKGQWSVIFSSEDALDVIEKGRNGR